MLSRLKVAPDPRLLAGDQNNEDAAILRFPSGKALVQTVDFFTPVVNDPYHFGQIAAANALSDVYAMGAEPFCAMNIVCFPAKKKDPDILLEILKGGYDKIREAGAVLAGGHSVEDEEIKYGLAVSGTIDPESYAKNAGIAPGDALVLTKPIGTGVLATAVKAKWEGWKELEKLLYSWASRLNKTGGKAIQEFGLKGATDITGFGLGGHLLEMALASDAEVHLNLDSIPVIEQAVELTGMGLFPEGSHANRNFCKRLVSIADGLDPNRVDIVFDAQTSGGLVLCVPEDKLQLVVSYLENNGEPAHVIGEAKPHGQNTKRLYIH